jgi:hypothetical protein
MGHADMDRRPRLIAGLRALAAYLETHPDVPAPYSVEAHVFASGSDDVKRAQVDQIAALIGTQIEADRLSHGHYSTRRAFGPVRYNAVAILDAARARYDALMTYRGSVTPRTDSAKEM